MNGSSSIQQRLNSDDWPVCPLHLYLANGVTTIRDFGAIGDDPRFVLRWRDDINHGRRHGPMFYTCGPIPGVDRSLLDLFGTDDAQKIVHELKETGYLSSCILTWRWIGNSTILTGVKI